MRKKTCQRGHPGRTPHQNLGEASCLKEPLDGTCGTCRKLLGPVGRPVEPISMWVAPSSPPGPSRPSVPRSPLPWNGPASYCNVLTRGYYHHVGQPLAPPYKGFWEHGLSGRGRGTADPK